MGSVAKLFTQNIIWRGLYYLVNFILTFAVARYFQASISGTIFYVINNCALITLLLSISFESAIIFFASEKEIKLSKLFHFAVLWIVGIALLLFFIFLFVKPAFSNSFFVTHFSSALLFILGNIMTTFMGSFYFAQKKFVFPNLISIIVSMILILLLFCINENNWLTSERFLSFYFGSYLIQGVLLSLFLLRSNLNFSGFSLLNKIELSRLFKYLSLVFFSNLITFFCYRIDYWFVYYFCSAGEMGNYIQVSKLAQLFFIFPGILAAVVFPLTTGGEEKKVKEIIPALTRGILLLYAVLCVGLGLCGKWLFPFIFGNSFLLMYPAFLFYIPGIIGFSALYIFTSFYSGRDMVMVNIKGCLLALTITLIGDLVFVPLYGINAAATISSCAYLAYFIFVLHAYVMEFDVPIKDFFGLHRTDLKQVRNFILKKKNP